MLNISTLSFLTSIMDNSARPLKFVKLSSFSFHTWDLKLKQETRLSSLRTNWRIAIPETSWGVNLNLQVGGRCLVPGVGGRPACCHSHAATPRLLPPCRHTPHEGTNRSTKALRVSFARTHAARTESIQLSPCDCGSSGQRDRRATWSTERASLGLS